MLHFVLFLISQCVVKVLLSTCCSHTPATTVLFISSLNMSPLVTSSSFVFTVPLGRVMVLQPFQDLSMRAKTFYFFPSFHSAFRLFSIFTTI